VSVALVIYKIALFFLILGVIGWAFSKASRFMAKHDADIKGKEKNPWR